MLTGGAGNYSTSTGCLMYFLIKDIEQCHKYIRVELLLILKNFKKKHLIFLAYYQKKDYQAQSIGILNAMRLYLPIIRGLLKMMQLMKFKIYRFGLSNG